MIDYLGDFLQHNLVFLLAVIIVPLKILIIRFCRDREGEAAAILSVPEDLCYVALGLITSDLIIPTGALHHHFAHSRHIATDIVIAVVINVITALIVHVISQPAQRAYKRWRGTEALRVDEVPVQGELSFAASTDDAATHLVAHHFSTLALLYVTQLLLVLLLLHWLAKVIAEVQQ